MHFDAGQRKPYIPPKFGDATWAATPGRHRHLFNESSESSWTRQSGGSRSAVGPPVSPVDWIGVVIVDYVRFDASILFKDGRAVANTSYESLVRNERTENCDQLPFFAPAALIGFIVDFEHRPSTILGTPPQRPSRCGAWWRRPSSSKHIVPKDCASTNGFTRNIVPTRKIGPRTGPLPTLETLAPRISPKRSTTTPLGTHAPPYDDCGSKRLFVCTVRRFTSTKANALPISPQRD